MDLNSSRIDTTAPTKKPYGEILKDDYANSYDAFKEGGWGPQEVARHAYNISQAKGDDDFDTWASKNGVNDFLATADSYAKQKREEKAWQDAQPESRGWGSSAVTTLGRGTLDAVAGVGRSLAVTDLTPTAIDQDKGILDSVGEGIANWAEEKKAKEDWLRPTKEEESGEIGAVKEGVMSGVQSMPATAAIAAGAGTGALIGGPVGAAAVPFHNVKRY
jgi:hypothetical protein